MSVICETIYSYNKERGISSRRCISSDHNNIGWKTIGHNDGKRVGRKKKELVNGS